MSIENPAGQFGDNSEQRIQRRRGAPKGNGNALKHGLNKKKRAIKKRGIDAIDGRTIEGRDALKFRADAIRDAGGKDQITAVKMGAIDVTTCDRYMWRSGLAYILTELGSVVNKRKKAFYQIVKDVSAMGDQYMRHGKEIGYGRQAEDVTDFARAMAILRDPPPTPQPNGEDAPTKR